MSRSRSFRRAQRERIIRRRLALIRSMGSGWYTAGLIVDGKVWRETRTQKDFWGHDVPGRWCKVNPYTACSCPWCHWRVPLPEMEWRRDWGLLD